MNSDDVPVKRYKLVQSQQACLCFEIHSPEKESPAGSRCGRQSRESCFCGCLIHVDHEVLSEYKIVIPELPKLHGQNITICKADALPDIRYDHPLIARPIEYPRLKSLRQIVAGGTETIFGRVAGRIGDPKRVAGNVHANDPPIQVGKPQGQKPRQRIGLATITAAGNQDGKVSGFCQICERSFQRRELLQIAKELGGRRLGRRLMPTPPIVNVPADPTRRSKIE